MNALQPIQTDKPTIESLTKAIVAQVDVLGLPTFQGAPMHSGYQTDPNEGTIWVTWNGGANDYHIATVTERADGRLAITVYVETGEGNKHFNQRRDGSEVGAAAEFIVNTVFELVGRWEDAHARSAARKVADAEMEAWIAAGKGGVFNHGKLYRPTRTNVGLVAMTVEPVANRFRADYSIELHFTVPMAEGLDAILDRVQRALGGTE